MSEAGVGTSGVASAGLERKRCGVLVNSFTFSIIGFCSASTTTSKLLLLACSLNGSGIVSCLPERTGIRGPPSANALGSCAAAFSRASLSRLSFSSAAAIWRSSVVAFEPLSGRATVAVMRVGGTGFVGSRFAAGAAGAAGLGTATAAADALVVLLATAGTVSAGNAGSGAGTGAGADF